MFTQPPLSDGLFVKPIRPDRRVIRIFIKYYTFIVGGMLSLIIVFSLWPLLNFWTLTIIFGYLIYIATKRMAQNNKILRKVYAKSSIQSLRFLLIVSLVTLLLSFLYKNTSYIKLLNNDMLWLLYLPALSIISQRGSRWAFLLSLILILFIVYLITPVRGMLLYQNPKPITFEIVSRLLWLIFLSGTSYILQRYMGDAIADLNLVINIQNKIRELEAFLLRSKLLVDEKSYLEKAIEVISSDLSYDHVNIFKFDIYNKKLVFVAAACKRGKELVGQGFEIDVDDNKSIISNVAKKQKPYLANNVNYDDNYLPHIVFPKTKAELVVPIFVRGRLYGVLDVQVHQTQYFLDQDQKAVEILANQIGWVIDNSEQFGHINWINRVVETIADPIFTQSHLDDTLQEIADTAYKEMEADLVLLYAYDQGNKDGLVGPIYAGVVNRPEYLQNPFSAKDNIVWRLIADDGEIYLNENFNEINPRNSLLFKPSDSHITMGVPTFIDRENIQSHAVVRLLIRKQCVGVLFLNFRKPRLFSAWDKRRYFSFAHLAALAIHKMQLQQHLVQTEKNELSNMFHDMLIADAVGIHKILRSIDLDLDSEERIYEKIERAIDGTQILNNDIRNILRLLKENPFEDLEIELEKLFLLLQGMFKINIEYSLSNDLRQISDANVRELYLVVREALTNAIRHGKAVGIEVVAKVKSQSLKLTITDNGVGFILGEVKRVNGLMSMKHRVEKIMGGDFDITSSPGRGTKISISIPMVLRNEGVRNE